mmetsp:Transcript_15970/g.40959  ORF Transcript_15970/g.40959 Transcript_15970/m.40959 type:complete len:141 (-) Transcript_15970:273-695(-)
MEILGALHVSEHTSEDPADKNAKLRDKVDQSEHRFQGCVALANAFIVYPKFNKPKRPSRDSFRGAIAFELFRVGGGELSVDPSVQRARNQPLLELPHAAIRVDGQHRPITRSHYTNCQFCYRQTPRKRKRTNIACSVCPP